MTEHEQNLYDLYAGLAMIGWVLNGNFSDAGIANRAHNLAEHMMQVRKARHEQTQTDMAVPDVEGRQDSDADAGIKALKKTKAGLK